MEKRDILSMDLSEIEAVLTEIGEKKFRAKQIFQWLHVKRVFDFDKMTEGVKDAVELFKQLGGVK